MKLNLSPLCLIFYKPDLGTRNGEVIYGEAKGPFIWLREDCLDDAGILNHELEHVRQAWRGLIIFHTILLWIPAYREWCEKKALVIQT